MLPASASAAAAVIPTTVPVETFSLYDSEQVGVELLTAAVTVNAPSQVEQYAKAFGRFAAQAVYGAQARALIMAAIDSVG